jgi:hypothetical protein
VIDGGKGIDTTIAFEGIFAVAPTFKQFENHP